VDPYAEVAVLDGAVKRATEMGATIAWPRMDLSVGSVLVIQHRGGRLVGDAKLSCVGARAALRIWP
jgi:hypothetical protein